MMFWVAALAILIAAALLTLWPLASGSTRHKAAAFVLALVVPALAAWLYHGVGTPAALDPEARKPVELTESDISDMTERLRARLTERAEDVEGWVLLGRTYKTLQRYPDALAALETADRLVPGNPMIVVELVEARLFASGDPNISDEMITSLEHAVNAEPSLQKGYWLLGIAAAQRGDDRGAIERWEALLQQVEPGSGVAEAVTAQIADARARLGEAPAEASSPGGTPAPQGEGQFAVEISVPEPVLADLASFPPQAALFVIVRPAGEAAGPPLGVRRVDRPEFPVNLVLSDADSMLPQRPISSAGAIEIQARLSRAGQPMPAAGDWQSQPVSPRGTGQPTRLMLDQQVR